MPSQGVYTPTRQLEDEGSMYQMPMDSAIVNELQGTVAQLQGEQRPHLAVGWWTALLLPNRALAQPQAPRSSTLSLLPRTYARSHPILHHNLIAELQAEKQRAKDIIVQLKREVEQVLNESEASAHEAREASAQLLAAAQAEAGRQRDNVEWLQNALERAEERARALEHAALASGNVDERVSSAVAKARAPLELRAEGLAVRARPTIGQPQCAVVSSPPVAPCLLLHLSPLTRAVLMNPPHQAQVKTLSTDLESERRKYSDLQRKSREVHQLEAALQSLQSELAEETSRSIAMEERLTMALQEEKLSTQALVDQEMAKLRAARRALEHERDAAVAAARKEADDARRALETEQSKASTMKDRLKAEVMQLMQQREGALLDHVKQMETALEQAQAQAAAARQETEELRAKVMNGTASAAAVAADASDSGAPDRALTARAEQLAADLATEKEYSASLERQLKAVQQHQQNAGDSHAPGTPSSSNAGSPSVVTELNRSREAMARLREELSSSRQQVAQLQAELGVQGAVIERTEALVAQRHQLAGEVRRLRMQLEEEQVRARDTELQLIGEMEVLMRELPGQLSRNRSGASPAGEGVRVGA